VKRHSRKILILILAVILFSICIGILNFRTGDIEYVNSDATWHTLLTIRAYKETPVSVHKFLPIVSLGKLTDKHISWGGAVPDQYGNHYYTSFSPTGYFLPYLFMEVFSLEVNETSLYIFNTFLLVISSCLLAIFLLSLFDESSHKWLISFFGTVIYVLEPEILHGMGLVYWHHSVMQVTLLLQIYCYWKYRKENSKGFKFAFYILCFINPYIEWTGYVANIGFALSELVMGRKKMLSAFADAVKVGILTVMSFTVFTLHFLLNISPERFLTELKLRSKVRSFAANISTSLLFRGYLTSFCYTWILLFSLLILATVIYKGLVWRKQSVLIKNFWIIFVASFPILENFIMKEHAILYPYDRMKLIFPVCLICCDLIYLIFKKSSKAVLRVVIFLTVSLAGLLNVYAYRSSPSYVWDAPYMNQNRVLADYLNTSYPDAVYCTNTTVRGYINLTFGRGVHETASLDSIIPIAQRSNVDKVVYFEHDPAVDVLYVNFPTASYGVEWQAIVYTISDDSYRIIHADSNGRILDKQFS